MEEDRDVTRFLWVKDPNKELFEDNLLHFRFCRVPFGVISSPFLLTATIRYHMANTDGTLLKRIADKCYVDNLVTTATSTSQAEELYHSTRKVFETLSMNIREWSSNDQEFVNKIPEEYRSKETEKTKVLGLTWNLKDDSLQLKINEDIFKAENIEKTKDKRGVLRTIASFYDPCGFAAPLVLPAKMLLQELWKNKMKWDTPLDVKTREAWKIIMDNLQAAKHIRLPRYIGLSKPHESTEIDLHCFSDASINGYSAVAYLRVTNNQEIKVSFIMSKSRVTPLKEQDNLKIPRLELLGYLIGSRLIKYIRDNLDLTIDRLYLWTDSLIVLSWMKSSKLLPPFVSRRVDEIKQNSSVEFCYINTKENPADLATRPELWLQKRDLWFNGPAFLAYDKSLWPKNTHVEDHRVLCLTEDALDDEIPDITEDYSTVDVGPDEEPVFTEVSQEVQAEIEEIKTLQAERFPKEVEGKETHLTRNLGLFMDVDGVLRCKGRMKNTNWSYEKKHPILLPRNCSFTSSVIQNVHEANYHVGVLHTLNIIREKYWVPQGRAEVQKILRRCPRCVKHGGGPYQLPPTPSLPAERVNYSQPFTYTGMDDFGPLFVSTETGTEKRWICLFTCLAVRAIHMEVVKNLSAEECLLALRRFISTRGLPLLIVSDNASQFKLTSEVCTKSNLKWRFIPQLAPWHGGFYERLIGLVKHCMKRTLEKHLLNDSQLATIMKEIEAVVNSRPLTCVGSEPESVLKPSDFLNLGRCIPIEHPDRETGRKMTTTKYDLIEGWKRGQKILDEMKSMFTGQYLPSLRERHRYSPRQPRVRALTSPQIGDVVQIKGDSKNRDNWKVGRITSLIQGSEGEYRVAKVKVGKNEFIRSIAHLYPLEADMDNNSILGGVKQGETSNVTDVPLQSRDVEMTDVSGIEEQMEPNLSLPVDIINQLELDSSETRGIVTEGDLDESTVSSGHENVEITEETQEALCEKSLEPCESSIKRAAAIRARQKIAEWMSQLAALL